MFIQMVQGGCAQQDDMRMLVDDWCKAMSERPGWLGGTYGFTDDGSFVGVVRYESAAACRELCSSDDAALWWACAETLFTGAPEIHQSEDVAIMLEGGSDDAGFVQVIQSRVKPENRARLLDLVQREEAELSKYRPDVIGGTIAIDEDGVVTETVAFTSESEARIGEKREMPAEVAQQFDEQMTLVEDVTYIDLHHPWFASGERTT